MEQFLSKLLNCDRENVYDALESLLNLILQKKALHEYEITQKDLENFTNNVIETQERLLANNFVPLTKKQIYKIYKELY